MQRTVSPIAPRCTGMCGALTTRSPPAVNTAQLKSSRSFTFTLEAVLRSVMPICSAMAAKRLLKISSIAGSHSAAVIGNYFDLAGLRSGCSLRRRSAAIRLATVLRLASRDR